MIEMGVAYRKTEETDLLERYGRNGGPVHREGCGIPQNGTPRDTVHLHRRAPPASTGYCSSTIDLLQPPPATVHPRAHVHPASTDYCSTRPLHGLLFIQPSTDYYSTSPPRCRLLHPALHGVLFIQPQPARSRQRHGVLFIHPHRSLFIQTPPQRSLFIQRGSIDRLQLAAVAKESLNQVQLTAIDQSLGFSNT